MKLEQKHIDQFRAAFEKMQSKEDFLNLLNLGKPLLYGEKVVPFHLKQITWHANPKLGIKRYNEFKIKKKSGADRSIHAPIKGLKSIQKTLSIVLQSVFEPHKAAMGFVRSKSIVTNARLHERSNYVFNIDLKDFFPSIDQARFWKCLQLHPFNLKGQGKDKVANMIASLCCTEMEVERKNESGEWEKVRRNVVPQGAPTSPVITNIVCQRLDFILTGVAKRFRLKYSRYADDITFSSMHNVFQPESEFLKELHRIIEEQGFHIKESKTRLQKDGHRKEVTGLLVNEKVNVQKRYIKQLRMWLYYWEQYGYDRAYGFFVKQYFAEKGHVKKGKPDMGNVIAGKLEYLKMVKGSINELYLKLKERFDTLINKSGLKASGNVELLNDGLLPNILLKHQAAIKTGILPKRDSNADDNKNKNLPEKIQITIDSLDPKIQKLKRNIFYRKGENLPIANVLENSQIEEKVIDLSKHRPIDVTSFLMYFRNSEGIKFLTHEYDRPNSVFNSEEILYANRELCQ